jgi:hypothetical protein
VPTGILVFLDALFQWTGAWWQLAPSVFVRAKRVGRNSIPPSGQDNILSYFKCPDCGHSPLKDKTDYLECSSCDKKWGASVGIYDFREPMKS